MFKRSESMPDLRAGMAAPSLPFSLDSLGQMVQRRGAMHQARAEAAQRAAVQQARAAAEAATAIAPAPESAVTDRGADVVDPPPPQPAVAPDPGYRTPPNRRAPNRAPQYPADGPTVGVAPSTPPERERRLGGAPVESARQQSGQLVRRSDWRVVDRSAAHRSMQNDVSKMADCVRLHTFAGKQFSQYFMGVLPGEEMHGKVGFIPIRRSPPPCCPHRLTVHRFAPLGLAGAPSGGPSASPIPVLPADGNSSCVETVGPAASRSAHLASVLGLQSEPVAPRIPPAPVDPSGGVPPRVLDAQLAAVLALPATAAAPRLLYDVRRNTTQAQQSNGRPSAVLALKLVR